MERTLLIVKPDGVDRRLVGGILSRIERKGYTIECMKTITIDRELAEKHYAEHKGKPFYDKLISYITSGPAVVAVISGEGCVGGLRYLMGNTDPLKAAPGTIRGDYATNVTKNLIHGSDTLENAEREIALFFGGE
ncbi:MAG: nucleoside-diphosphate kinase [Actinobacteria bacterium]|nr:nucleoside-diphosphate kinase [Actinomycetota bacterium]MBU4301266.1 nucleoside-diphosphate kinase [Actinomycetota bacterium]MBU4490213.1 nucleoside-diphosphate kinase [Actinomycetota bacterium]